MKIVLSTYPWAYDTPGGGERQLDNYHAAFFRGQKKWPDVSLEKYNPWEPKFHGIDLLHYFGCMPSSLDFVNFAKIQKNVPVVISPNFWPDPDGWAASGVLDNIRTMLWLVDKIIVNSYIEEEALVRLMQIDSSKIAIVSNAVDDKFFEIHDSGLFRKKFNISGEYILNVGNVEPRKNQFAFLQALKNHPQLKLVTVGAVRENWYAHECKKIGGEQFHLIDPLEPNSALLRSAMAGCSLFAMPSLVETPSIASLEAAAAGCRILTTELGSTKEYFKNDAVYINPYDLKSMENGISLALSKSKSADLSERVKRLYRWDIVTENLVAEYRRIAK